MTTICACIKGKDAVIAADTRLSYGSMRIPNNPGVKIFKFARSYVSISGFLTHQLAFKVSETEYLERSISFESTGDIFKSLCCLQDFFESFCGLKPDYGKEHVYGSNDYEILILNKNGIFSVDAWKTVCQHDNYWAIGSGQPYALGAMYSVFNHSDAMSTVVSGIKAGAEFDNYTSMPYTYKRFSIDDMEELP